MLESVLRFPASAEFGKIVAKEKILQLSKPSSEVKKRFQDQIDRIRCSHEITGESVNLETSHEVPKILVIQLFLKDFPLHCEVLSTIDRAFGVPLFFEMHYQGKIAYCACYRRRSDSEQDKWIFSDYFQSDWFAPWDKSVSLTIALNLQALYEQLVSSLIPLSMREGETIRALVNRMERTKKLEREITLVENRIRKEKQFNRKVAINAELRRMKQELEGLIP